MKELLIFFLFASLFQPNLAQTTAGQWAADPIVMGSNNLYGKSPNKTGVVNGTTYLDTKWNIADITFFDSEKLLEGIPVKYDLKENRLELFASKEVRMVEVKKIKSLVWRDSLTHLPKLFINGNGYNEDGAPLTGLLEVLVDGKIPLLKRNFVSIRKPDFVAEMGTGNIDTEISRSSAYYYALGEVVTEITSRKTLLHAFGSDASEVKKFMNTNNSSIRSEHDLIRVFKNYNEKFK